MGKGPVQGLQRRQLSARHSAPGALDLLERLHLPTAGLRSKSWDEFARPEAPRMDFVITVCDQAAGEVCPVWPGKPVMAHWSVPDPAAADNDPEAVRRAFRDAHRLLESRIKLFAALPLDKLERLALKQRLDEIGRHRSPTQQETA